MASSRVGGLRVERVLDFGAYWLCYRLLQRVGLPDLLNGVLEKGREEVPWSVMAMVLPTRSGMELRRQCISRPTKAQAIPFDRLKLRLPRTVAVQEM